MPCPGFHLKYTFSVVLRFWKKILQYYQDSIHSKHWLLVEDTPTVQDNDTSITLIWCLKQLKGFILKYSISESFFFHFLTTNTCLFSFRWLCWWGCWHLNKLSRIQIWSLFPSVSCTDIHTFHESWVTLSNYQNYF